MKKTSEEQLLELESYWNLNPEIVCDGCEKPLEIDMSCFEQMAESVKIDMEDVGYVKHVVLRCDNAFGNHADECDYDCTYDDGDKYYGGIICHNFNTWVDLWDYRFADEEKEPKVSNGAKFVKESA